MPELSQREDIIRVLEETRVIAVLGAHPTPHKAAFYVPDYLSAQGYRIIPVNPGYAGQQLWGETVLASLIGIEEPVDMVDVFRRGEVVAQHVAEILAMLPAPAVVWLQLGIRNDTAARELVAAGIDVVQDRCTLADHRAFGIAPKRG